MLVPLTQVRQSPGPGIRHTPPAADPTLSHAPNFPNQLRWSTGSCGWDRTHGGPDSPHAAAFSPSPRSPARRRRAGYGDLAACGFPRNPLMPLSPVRTIEPRCCLAQTVGRSDRLLTGWCGSDRDARGSLTRGLRSGNELCETAVHVPACPGHESRPDRGEERDNGAHFLGPAVPPH